LRHSSKYLSALVCVFLAAAAAYGAEPTTVLVFPFEAPVGHTTLRWVGDAVSHSVAGQIQIPGIKVFSDEERDNLLQGSDLPSNVPLSHASMIQVARTAGAQKLIMGSWSGTERDIRVTARVLDVRTIRLGGELSANGPLAALPEMENELAWLLLGETGVSRPLTRDQFKERRRSIPNAAYAAFVHGLATADDNDQVAQLQKALEQYPDIPEASYLVGRHYYHHGDYDSALRFLNAGQKWQPGYLDDLFMLGTCYVRRNELDAAIQSYGNILAFSRSAEALNNLGVAYLRKGDYPLAVENLVEAHRLAAQHPTVALNLAIARHLQGNDDVAERLLEQTAKSEATRGVAQYLLSLIMERRSRKDAAEAALAKAVSAGIDPEKMKSEGPKSWTRLITAWDNRI
jgi:type IV pilus assembly protein PilF